MKRRIRLNESQLRQMISNSVKKVLNEIGDTERGQRYLANAHVKKNRKFWDKWNKQHGWPSDEERQDSQDIIDYAFDKSRGKDSLRRAFRDEQGRILNNEPGNGYHNFPEDHKEEYPHDNPIDVDALFDELEDYANKTNLKITEGDIDGISIYGKESDFSLKAAYADVAYIAGNYGVDNNAITYNYFGSRYEPEYKIHINLAMTKHGGDLSIHDKVKRRNYPYLSQTD